MELLTYTIIGTVIGTLLALEAKAWLPYLSAGLVRSTLRKMPDALDDQLCSRWGEEIEGDLYQYRDRPLGGFIFALRLRWKGGKRLAAELALERTLGASHPAPESHGKLGRPGVIIAGSNGRQMILRSNEDGVVIQQVVDVDGTVLKDWRSSPLTLEALRQLEEGGKS